MVCCLKKKSEEEYMRFRTRSCTDTPWFYVALFAWGFIVVFTVFSFFIGDPPILLNGFDSFGNVCGSSYNMKLGDYNLSGIDTINKTKVFFFEPGNEQSLKICVESCPPKIIKTLKELENYQSDTGHSLCRYNFSLLDEASDYSSHGINETWHLTSHFGPCPVLPVQASSPVLNHCTPNHQDFHSSSISGPDWPDYISTQLYFTWETNFMLGLLALGLCAFACVLFFVFPRTMVILVMCGSIFIILCGVAVSIHWSRNPEMYSHFYFSQHLENYAGIEKLVVFSVGIIAFFCFTSLLATGYLFSCTTKLKILFNEAFICVCDVPLLLLLPGLCLAFIITCYICWIKAMIYLVAARFPETKYITSDLSMFIKYSNLDNMENGTNVDGYSTRSIMKNMRHLFIKPSL